MLLSMIQLYLFSWFEWNKDCKLFFIVNNFLVPFPRKFIFRNVHPTQQEHFKNVSEKPQNRVEAISWENKGSKLKLLSRFLRKTNKRSSQLYANLFPGACFFTTRNQISIEQQHMNHQSFFPPPSSFQDPSKREYQWNICVHCINMIFRVEILEANYSSKEACEWKSSSN